MPFGTKPACALCQTTTSNLWRKTEAGETICNGCFLKPPNGNTKETPPDIVERRVTRNGNGKDPSAVGSQYVGPIRKSARLKPSKYKFQPSVKALPTKGKNRRVVFKKNPIKSAINVATVITGDYTFHDGIYWQVGDIANVMDEGGGIYYVQLRGFLQDQFCRKSAVITWLLPTRATNKDSFDPSTYILGPEEDVPRKLECFEFVCHAPSEYFRCKTSPYDTKPDGPDLAYVSTTMGSQIRRLPCRDAVFGLKDMDDDEVSEPVVPHKEKGKDKSKDKEDKKEKHTRRERKDTRERGREKRSTKEN